jgi:hypothetical protein
MGFGASLITFSPGTLMKSADVDSNFTNLNNANSLSGSVSSASFAGHLQTNGGSTGISASSGGQATFNSHVPQDSSGNFYQTYAETSGSGSGTYNHNYNGTPSIVLPVVDSFGNAEGLGIDSIGSTTWHLNMPTFYSWHAVATHIV